MTAHRDDSLGAHQLGGKHAEKTDRTVADDRDRRAGLHVRGVGGEPAGAHHVGDGQQARDQVVRGRSGRRHQSAVGERDAQQRRLGAADELPLLTRCLVAGVAVRTGVVGGEERPDHKLAGLDRPDRPADLFDNAAILVAHRGRFGDPLNAAVRPEIRPADAGRPVPREPWLGVTVLSWRQLLAKDAQRQYPHSCPDWTKWGLPTLVKARQ